MRDEVNKEAEGSAAALASMEKKLKEKELIGSAADIHLEAEVDTSHAEGWTNMTDEEAICYL